VKKNIKHADHDDGAFIYFDFSFFQVFLADRA